MFYDSYDPSNYSGIFFPGLNLEVNPGRVLQIGSLSIHYYGLIIAIGLALAVVYGLRRRKAFGLTEDDILDGALIIVPFAILCARAYYCAFSWDSFKDNPISVLYIWNGGLAIYGGVIGAAIGIVAYCKVKKISLGATLDIVALGFLIGQFIGRWGNFMNREAFGAVVPKEYFLAMGLYNEYLDTYEYFHPTFLYESLWNFAGFIGLHFLSKKRQYDGQIALGYVAWYGLGRTFIEGLRTDSLWWGPFRVSQLLAAVSCLIAVVVLLIQAFRGSDRANLYVNRVAAKAAAKAQKQEIAWEDGSTVTLYTLKNAKIEADILTYGGTVAAIHVPDKEGNFVNVALTHENLTDYAHKPGYVGALVGRFGNRIGDATFSIDGETYTVSANEKGNCLHGGLEGFDKKHWTVDSVTETELTLSYVSPDGEEGFPGNLEVTVTYSLTEEGGLRISYQAVTDKDTTVNLTNHSYFNPNGEGSTTEGLLLTIDADAITKVDEALIPHGEITPVEGTLFDFRQERPFICDLSADPVLGKRGCYDENFVLSGEGFRLVSTLYSEKTGILMETYTDQPGMQIYTGNKKGIALETQNFPNAINCPNFPNAILRVGDTYHTETEYRFTIR